MRALEERLVALATSSKITNGTKIAAVVTASGMAVVSGLVLTFLGQGDHLIASEMCYAGSVELFAQNQPLFGIEVSLVDTSDPAQVKNALRKNTRLIYVETPANPILRIADISELANITHNVGTRLAVDSTWVSPALQQPFSMGVDFIIHSLTQ